MANLPSDDSAATMLDEHQQPNQSASWGEYECQENSHQSGVMMMGVPTTTTNKEDAEAPMMIPSATRRVSNATTTTKTSSCLGKHKFDALISTNHPDSAYTNPASKTPRTTIGSTDFPSSTVTAATSSTSSTTTTKSTMTDFAFDPHDPSILPVAPFLQHSSSIDMGLALPSFLDSAPSFGSLLGDDDFPPPPRLSFAGSEARFAIAGNTSSSFSHAGVFGANVSEEDTAAAVSALLDLTPAVSARHHHHIHGRTPLTELNRDSSSGQNNHHKASRNSNSSTSTTNTSTTTTTANMWSLPQLQVAHGFPSHQHHQQTNNSTQLVASIHNAALTASRLLLNAPISDKACKCKKSHCLKLYCACFQNGTLCDPTICNCKECKNTNAYNGPHGDRAKAVGDILGRRIGAFDKARPKKKTGAGCACKKTKCLKKYCDCFNNGVKCGDACTCTDCANADTTQAELSVSSPTAGGLPTMSPQPV